MTQPNTPTRVLLSHILAFIFQRSYWFCKHSSLRIIIQHILSLLYCGRHSKKRLTSIWVPTGANVAGHGCEISASAFKTINYFLEDQLFWRCGRLICSGIDDGVVRQFSNVEASDLRWTGSELSSIIDLHASVSLLFTDIPKQQSPYHAHLVLWLLLEYYLRTISPPHRRPCHDVSKMGKTYRS